jgi:DNA-directed RNA polymerase specialized sigma24 family protein
MEQPSIKKESEFGTFLKRERPFLFAFIYRVVGEDAFAEDIVQNTLVEAFLEVSERTLFQCSRNWLLKIAYNQLNLAVGKKRPWSIQEANLVSPILTDEPFWNSIKGEQNKKVAFFQPKESFHIGLLTVLQRLSFQERVAYIGHKVLGLAIEGIAHLMDLLEEDVRERIKNSEEVMQRNYFSRDSLGTLWRGEQKKITPSLNKFVEVLNGFERESFKASIDSKFCCLLVPTPIFSQDLFFEGFLAKISSCKIMDFEINGQRAFVFEDPKEIEALAIVLHSKEGVSTVLGYGLDVLSPKIRNKTLASVGVH